MYHENNFTGGRSGDNVFKGFEPEMKKNNPAIKNPETVIWLLKTTKQDLQITILHAINVQHRERISVDQTVQCEDDVDLEGCDKGATAKAKNLKNYRMTPDCWKYLYQCQYSYT